VIDKYVVLKYLLCTIHLVLLLITNISYCSITTTYSCHFINFCICLFVLVFCFYFWSFLFVMLEGLRGRISVMVFNATFSNISVISWWSVFIGGGNRSTWRKPPTCGNSLTNLSHNVVSSTPHLSGIQTHNASGERHYLHR
jgi:hypothetical protein